MPDLNDNIRQAIRQNAVEAKKQEDAAKSSEQASGSEMPRDWFARDVHIECFSILAFGLIMFSVMAFLIYKGREPNAVLKICALPLVIISALFLIITGYTQTQIAPAMGLLGVIAGYLLGAKTSDPTNDGSNRES